MRILYLCPDLGIPVSGSKGAAVHVRSLVSTFAALGHDVLVLAAGGGDAIEAVPVVTIPQPGLSAAIAGRAEKRVGRALAHLWMNVEVERSLEAVLPRFRPDLLYERYGPFATAGGVVAERHGIHHVLEVNAPLAWEGREYRQQALGDAATALERLAFRSAGRVIAVSHELKTILVGDGVPASNVAVVPNGVDLTRFVPSGDAWAPASGGGTVVGFVGSLKPWHGIDLLVDGFRRAAVERPDLHLLVVGDGPEARLVDRLGAELPGRVSRVSAVPHEEIPRYLRGMAIAVAPYAPLPRFYYSPLKVLEYMAAGRAIVASALGQVPELLCHGEAGLLIPPGDARALAGALVRLADDPALRGHLGAAARRTAGQHGWEARAADILSLMPVRAAA